MYLKYLSHVKRSHVKPTLLNHAGILKNDGGVYCAALSPLLLLGLRCGLHHI